MSPAVTGSQLSVLIVEDDDRVRAFFRVALEGIARVTEARDGDAALNILEAPAAAVDLVVVDHVLPRLSGLELVRLVRQRWPWIPVVITTGFGSEDLAVQALRAGARDYLKKPIDVSELRRVILMHAPSAGPLGGRGAGSREAAPPVSTEAAVTHSGIRRALIFVRRHFTEPITLSQVALEAGLSRFHLCRLFRRQVGLSFRGYLQGLRIDHARMLLADRRLTVSEVAYATGFNDLSHFDKVFNRLVGVSPTEYRRAIRAA